MTNYALARYKWLELGETTGMEEINTIQRALLRGLGKSEQGRAVTRLAIPAIDRLESFGLVESRPPTIEGSAATVKVTNKGMEFLSQ